MPDPTPEPPWWPNGADEQIVEQCNCKYCDDLIDALEQERDDGVSVDGKHMSLQAVGGDD